VLGGWRAGCPPLRRISLGGPKDRPGTVDELFLLLVACGAVGVFLAVGAAALLRHRRSVLPTALEDRERLELRLNAPFDRTAATELRRRLMDDLKRHEAVRKHLRREGSSDRELTALMQAVDRAARATRQQIADIETWLGVGG
jgi:hypothetical protein